MEYPQFPAPASGILKFDVADQQTDRWICTLKMKVNPLFKVSLGEVLAFVYQKRPTLKYRKIQIEL